MIIKVKNKNTLILDDFKFKCCVGKNGISNQKKEGDKKTPRGTFQLGDLYFRKDRISKLETNLKTVPISKNMGWCDDIKSIKYNKIIRATKKLKYEKMYRKDANYDFLIPIKYNYKKPISGRGSAIFLHITKDYKKTLGCVAIKKRDMMILIRLINKKTKIKID